MSNESTAIREYIKEELKKCAASPVYFMRKYCKIQHPQRGTIQFNLYDFQANTLEEFLEHKINLILKSRQLGISTLCAGFALWLMIFNSDKNVLVIATKQDVAKNLITKVRFMYDKLPSWVKRLAGGEDDSVKEGKEASENNKLSLRLKNGSQIKAVSSASDSARSEALSMLIIDEAAFIDDEKVRGIWLSAQPTLSTGGRAIILSTPNGQNNFFHQKWVEAENNSNIPMHTIKLPWWVHPERDQKWRDEQDQLLGKRGAAQECDCEFSTSGNTVVEPELLKLFKQEWVEEPQERRGFDHNFWIWEYPDYNRDYIITADVARGDGSDFSACHVIDVERATQVAEYKGQLGTKEWGILLTNIATEYNNGLLVVENANIGWSTCQTIIDRGYQNMYYSFKDINYIDDTTIRKNLDLTDKANMVPGFTTSHKSRPLMVSRMELYFREKSCRYKSIRLHNELTSFVWKNGKPQANSGYNDDLVMSWAIGLWTRDTALRLRMHGIDMTKTALNNIATTKPSYAGAYSSNRNFHDPFALRLPQTRNNPNSSGIQDLREFL